MIRAYDTVLTVENDKPDTENEAPQSRVFGLPITREDPGRCFSCGFLARAFWQPQPTVYREVDWVMRFGMGPLPESNISEVRAGDTYPRVECFLQVINLQNLIAQELAASRDGDWDRAAKHVFWEDRQCPEWFPYSPGLGPEKHFDRYEMQRLEQDRRDFELRLQKASQALLADSKEIAEDNKKLVFGIKTIAEQMAASSAQSDRFGRRIAWLVVFLAFLQIVIGAFALTSDSWMVKLFQKRPAVEQPVESETNPSR